MKNPTITLVLCFSLLGATARSETPVPYSEDFQVNTYTTGIQRSGSVAVDDTGDFVVVWTTAGSNGADTDGPSVQGQRYDATGMPVGGEFLVNSYTTSYQSSRNGSSVDGKGDGSFVIVWASMGSDGTDTSGYSVQGQRFDVSGMPAGDEFQVNSYTSNSQVFVSVAVEPNGDFIVVWSSDGSDGSDNSGFSIQGQRFNASGAAVGDEFQVNTYTPNKQISSKVAFDAKGNFVVVWESIGSGGTDSDSYSIQARRYDTDGMAIGSQFQVNTYTVAGERHSKVAVAAEGDFVVVWDSHRNTGADTSFTSIQGQLYDAAGLRIGEEFLVNTYTTTHQRFASLAMQPDGDFVVVWESSGSTGPDTDGYSIQGQRFDQAGMLVGGEFQVNSYTTSSQARPYLAAGVDGDFAVVWESGGSVGTDSSQQSVQGQRYATPIFTDGFESADTSAWSSSQGGQAPF